MYVNYPRRDFSEVPSLQPLWDKVLENWPDAILFVLQEGVPLKDGETMAIDGSDFGFIISKDESNTDWFSAKEAIWATWLGDRWRVVIHKGMDVSVSGLGFLVLGHLTHAAESDGNLIVHVGNYTL